MKEAFARARTAFLQRCAVWSLPRVGVPERSVDYRLAGEYFGKSTRLDIATRYRAAALGSFESQDREMYGASWPASNWAQVVAEHKLKGEWTGLTTIEGGELYTVTRPAVSPNRVLGLFMRTRFQNRMRSRFGAWVMRRRG